MRWPLGMILCATKADHCKCSKGTKDRMNLQQNVLKENIKQYIVQSLKGVPKSDLEWKSLLSDGFICRVQGITSAIMSSKLTNTISAPELHWMATIAARGYAPHQDSVGYTNKAHENTWQTIEQQICALKRKKRLDVAAILENIVGQRTSQAYRINQGASLAPDSHKSHKSSSHEVQKYRDELETCLGQSFEEMEKIRSNENEAFIKYRYTTGLGVYIDSESALVSSFHDDLRHK